MLWWYKLIGSMLLSKNNWNPPTRGTPILQCVKSTYSGSRYHARRHTKEKQRRASNKSVIQRDVHTMCMARCLDYTQSEGECAPVTNHAATHKRAMNNTEIDLNGPQSCHYICGTFVDCSNISPPHRPDNRKTYLTRRQSEAYQLACPQNDFLQNIKTNKT